jgi:heme/copper-type cytochrome/quinol oxidase subunit 3
LVAGHYIYAKRYLSRTMFLGACFMYCQWYEYDHAQFSISDSVYGSIFYLMTGFHGLHVTAGLVLLFICYLRLKNWHFTREHHVGFSCAI